MSIDAPAWVRDAVFYQIVPDRFAPSERVAKPGPLEPWDEPPTTHGFKGGDLLGIVEHLDELLDLGITALYLTPVFASASNHRYHTDDYFTVDPLLGGTDALRELLDEAHGRGLRVILDGVFNHTGRGFWPFHHIVEAGAASPYRRWFHLDQEALDRGLPLDPYPGADSRNEAEPRGPNASAEGATGDGSWSLRRLGYRAWWDLPALPKLNTSEPAVREYLFRVAEHWLRFGIDGWRLDVPGEIDDEAFWQEFRRRCRAVRPDAYLVGEVWQVAPDWLRGDRFDALMNYPLLEAIVGWAAGASFDESVIRAHHELGRSTVRLDGAGFAARLEALLGAYDPAATAAQLNLLDSHDTPRIITMLGGDRQAYRRALLLQATLPGAPCLYYGDEVGVEGGNDPDCRRAYPWDSARQDRGLREFVRTVLRLRRAEPALRADGVRIVAVNGAAAAYERRDATGRFVVALNPGEVTAALRIAPEGDPANEARAVDLPGWPAPATTIERDGAISVELAAGFGAILRLK